MLGATKAQRRHGSTPMWLVPCVLAPRAMGQNQIVASSSQQPGDGLLDMLEGQRRLVGSVIEIRPLTL